MKEIVETVKLDSFKEEAPVQEEKKTEAIKPVKKEIKEPKAVSEKPRQPKPVKERAAKEKQPREFREPKEKQVREKTAKPVKPAKPVEILTDPEEIKEVENRAKVFLRDVFASMNLGEVEITSEYNTTDGSLDNTESITAFRYNIMRSLFYCLNRRSQKKSYNWVEFLNMLDNRAESKKLVKSGM